MNYQNIAITGHRDLLQEDERPIKARVKCLFKRLRGESGKPLKLYSALAPGADIWAAQCLEESDQLVVVEVLPQQIKKKYTFWGEQVGKEPEIEENEKDQEKVKKHRAKLTEYNIRKANFDNTYAPYLDLLNRKNKSIVNLVLNVNLNYDDGTVRNNQYIKLGEYLILNCDHLIALWDGVDGGGIGGTSDVVRMWQKGKGVNGNKLPFQNKKRTLHHLLCPREKNHFPVKRF